MSPSLLSALWGTGIIFVCVFGCSGEDDVVDLEKKFEPSLLNGGVYLISLAMHISTFAINYQVRLLYLIIFDLLVSHIVFISLWVFSRADPSERASRKTSPCFTRSPS